MRLTYWNERKGHYDWRCENNEVADKLAAYEDMELTPEEFKESVDFVLELNKKLKPYMDAEKEGRLVMLPKKLYGFYEWDVTGVRYYDGKVTAYCVKNEQVESIIFASEIGDSVFFTREEAEAAWKGGQDDG